MTTRGVVRLSLCLVLAGIFPLFGSPMMNRNSGTEMLEFVLKRMDNISSKVRNYRSFSVESGHEIQMIQNFADDIKFAVMDIPNRVPGFQSPKIEKLSRAAGQLKNQARESYQAIRLGKNPTIRNTFSQKRLEDMIREMHNQIQELVAEVSFFTAERAKGPRPTRTRVGSDTLVPEPLEAGSGAAEFLLPRVVDNPK